MPSTGSLSLKGEAKDPTQVDLSVMKIGPYEFDNPVALAPMAGVSDQPMRQISRLLGASYAVSEMVTSRADLWQSKKSRTRLVISGEPAPRIVQIAGGDAALMADAAEKAVALGADIVDINMGCPAKKVLNRHAGSALLRDEALVRDILKEVCGAVDVPVTLKMRTGWDPATRNGVRVACLAEDAGIAALSVHGRTRACGFRGAAEYQTIADIKRAVGVPVIANGDIHCAAEARHVLQVTGADGLMIGRAALGNPWIFSALRAAQSGQRWAPPTWSERCATVAQHLSALHALYGEPAGVRIARKHIGWYFETLGLAPTMRRAFNRIEEASAQSDFLALLESSEPVWKTAA